MRVAVLDDYFNKALEFADWSPLDGRAEVTVFNEHLGDEANVIEALKDFEIIVGMRERTAFLRSTIEKLPKLKLLITTGGRNRSFDMDAAVEHGVTVCHTGGFGSPTSELAWGLILGILKDIPGQFASMQQGGWMTKPGLDVGSRTLGLLGLGRLGARVAKVGLAFGMDCIAWSQNLTDDRAAEVGVKKVSKEELFSQADVISIHYVLSDRSRGIVGEKEIGLMKPTGYLVNTSRGPLIDEAALMDALTKKKIGGAALDTYWTEPLQPDHPIRKLDNVLLSPHMGYVTQENHEAQYADVVEDIVKFLDGDPVRVLAKPA
jgi:phosphoglycerate dehydrogenase-like enzyme